MSYYISKDNNGGFMSVFIGFITIATIAFLGYIGFILACLIVGKKRKEKRLARMNK